jgi:glycosyltransferase involved in cell wall biosynthesis
MLSDVLVSVVLPVYNAELYLEEAIKSILKQTYKNFEFIIVNDGSNDSSLEIIEKLMKNDSRIVLVNRENKGLVYTLNEGIRLAKGKYIARMDADDVSLSDRFEKQINFMESKKLDICGSHFAMIDESSNLLNFVLVPLSHETCSLSLASKVPFAHPSVMIRKSFLDENNLLYGQSQYQIAEDIDLWIRMFDKGAIFGNFDEILFQYRVLDNSLSRINDKGIRKDTKKLLDNFLIMHKDIILSILNQNLISKNDEEKSLVVRTVFKLFKKSFKISLLNHLKGIERKVVICTLISELYNS